MPLELARKGLDNLAARLPAGPRAIVHRLTRTDSLLLVRGLVVVLVAWLFLGVAQLVSRGHTLALDERILLALRTPGNLGVPRGPRWLYTYMSDLTSLGSAAVLTTFTLAVVGYCFVRRQAHAAWLVLGCTIGGAVMMNLLKASFERPRPTVVPHLVNVSSLSFPSGHAMISAAIYLTLGALLARLVQTRLVKLYCIGVALVISFIIGMTRVYLGVHYPSDVLAGWTAGLCWALICWTVASALQRQGSVEQPK
jgi:undecaprenyl-diphosphatase